MQNDEEKLEESKTNSIQDATRMKSNINSHRKLLEKSDQKATQRDISMHHP